MVSAIAERIVRERRGLLRCVPVVNVTKTAAEVAIGMPNANAATASVKLKK
ncbi:MAG: hypothetical protein GY949_08735 [Gammaproteobacteria bacterium]|nr:hypothetical protein [Gammaproteobacteria bacterium]